MLIDGARIYGACPNNMDPAAFHVDFAEVDRIEIGKGPFDMKNQGGLGGGRQHRHQAGAGGRARHRADLGRFVRVHQPDRDRVVRQRPRGRSWAATRCAVAIPTWTAPAARCSRTANYLQSAFDVRAFDVNTAWVRANLAAKAAHGFQASATSQRAATMLYPYLQMDATYDDADRLNLAYDYRNKLGPVQAVRVSGYATRVDHAMTDQFRQTSTGMAQAYSMATTATTSTQGMKAEAAFSGATAGVEVFRRGWNAETALAMMKYQPQYSIPDVTMTSVGVFLEYSRRLGDSVTLDLGGRLDGTRSEADAAKANTALYTAYQGGSQTSATDTYPSGKVRVAYRPAEGLTITGGLGHAVRVPDSAERYFALRRMGSDWVGNPFLVPTTNTGVELGVSWRAGILFLNARRPPRRAGRHGRGLRAGLA